MAALRMEARRRGVRAAIPEIPAFNSIFMRLAAIFGRVPEALLMGLFNLARGKLFQDARLGWELARRGRLKLLPKLVLARRSVAPVENPERKVGYFPGCASEGSAADYDSTARAAARALDIELVEPEGWTCCGASSAHATDAAKATAMPLRTIAAVERMQLNTLTSPCSSCYSRLKFSEQEAAGSVRVQHLLDTFMERAGREGIATRVRRPLTGLKVACYYGCLITRPSKITGAEHLQALGAQPVAWSSKTDCCGGSLGLTQTEAAARLTQRVVENARACGADLVVTMCPLCHMNLDARQPAAAQQIPIVHATQLMLLAFGAGEGEVLLDKALVDARPVLRAKGVV
jgi:heterodisulfide reductase subunit B